MLQLKKGRKHLDSNPEEVSLLVDQTLKTAVETTGGKLKDDKKKKKNRSTFDANVTEQGQILENSRFSHLFVRNQTSRVQSGEILV